MRSTVATDVPPNFFTTTNLESPIFFWMFFWTFFLTTRTPKVQFTLRSAPVESFVFGHTSQNLPILAHRFGQTTTPHTKRVLILAATHGDEIESIVVAEKLLEAFSLSFPYNLHVTVVPRFNLDGVLLKT